MEVNEAKLELIKRYEFLYSNAQFILAPYMYEQTEEEFKKLNRKVNGVLKEPLIYLMVEDMPIIWTLEEFLLSDTKFDESWLYKFVETKKNDSKYLQRVRNGLELLEKSNEGKEYFLTTLDINAILSEVWDYVQDQSADLDNKKKKLKILDEYYKLARYKNDGKIRFSGHDNSLNDFDSISISMHTNTPTRGKNDIGVTSNDFIKSVSRISYNSNNGSIFTEKEKQDVYLRFHDELPRDLEIQCDITSPSIIRDRIIRPSGTEPCDSKFYIKEEEIFVNPDITVYRYYHICPYCGFMVNIPKEILTEGVIDRIERRCEEDPDLFKKEFLYSELKQLDDKTPKGLRKVLK